MTTAFWKNNARGNWGIAANWTTGAVPGPLDDVAIVTSSPVTVTFSAGTDKVLSLGMGQGTLAMTGGSLSVLGNTNLSSITEALGATLTFGGVSTWVGGTVTQTGGKITVASGELDLRGSGSNAFAGTLAGAAVHFDSGSDTFQSGFALTARNVALDGATIHLGENLVYRGTWSQSFGTIALGGRGMIDTGSVNLDGGTIQGPGSFVASAGQIAGLTLQGGVTLKNAGSVVQTGGLQMNADASGNPKLVNQPGATFNIVGDNSIGGSAANTLTNSGTLVKSVGMGTTSIGDTVINTGSIAVDSGTMAFLSPVSGAGTIQAGAGTTLNFHAAVAAGGTVALGADADLIFDTKNAFAATIAGFAPGNLIELSNLPYSGATLSFNSALDRLTVTNGSSSVTLQLAGTYHASDFHLFSNFAIAAIAHS